MWGKKEKPLKEPRVDRMVIAVRQRRVLSAVMDVAARPEFLGARIKPRTLMDSDRLDQRRQTLGAEGISRSWPGPAVLADALHKAARLVGADDGANLRLDDDDEARWMHAQLPALLTGVATALPTLRLGFAVFADDELPEIVEGEAPRFRADAPTLICDLGLDADGTRTCRTVLAGAWPPEVLEVLGA